MRPLIAGNWNMHALAKQLGEIEAVAASVQATLPPADVLICLPATLIARAVQTAASRIAIAEKIAARSSLAPSREISAPRC